jgi:hypothetical protein
MGYPTEANDIIGFCYGSISTVGTGGYGIFNRGGSLVYKLNAINVSKFY